MFDFPIGTEYMIDDIIFKVRKAMKVDNMEMRRIYSLEMGDQIISLSSLQDDFKSKHFHLITGDSQSKRDSSGDASGSSGT